MLPSCCEWYFILFYQCDRTPIFLTRLQCAALMYERTSKQTRQAARSVADNKVPRTAKDGVTHVDDDDHAPGSRIRQTCGEKSANAVDATLRDGNDEEDKIRSIADEDLELKYYPISECNSMGSAFCALFWKPEDSFIIVSFKGTTPTDFMEWRTDFTFQRIHANHCVTGFGTGASIRLIYNSFVSISKLAI